MQRKRILYQSIIIDQSQNKKEKPLINYLLYRLNKSISRYTLYNK